MNPDNVIHLDGTVQGDAWTRWPVKRPGQVRFWLAVSRELAGEGMDVFLCAVAPRSAEELYALEREIRAGRRVRINAEARRTSGALFEDEPGVIFIAEECGFDGAEARNAHTLHRRHAAHGKCAAAGDVDGAAAELPLLGGGA